MRKKKFSSVLMAIICSFSILSTVGCAPSNQDNGKLAKVWTALSSEVFVQDILPETYPEAKLDFYAMKGETESMQIMITANKFVRGIDIETTDLVDESGNVISKDNIKLYAEHYVEIANPYVNTGNTTVTILSPAGYYPDALIPFNNFKAKREDRVQEGHNQGVWVDVVVPVDVKAGNYTSTIKVILGEEREEHLIPVTLKVYDITMPEEVHSRSSFNIWYSQIASGEKSNYDNETNQRYYDFLLEKRLCSGSVDPNKRANLDQYVDYMVEIALNPKVTTYQMPNNFIGISNQTFLAERPPEAVGLAETEIAKRKNEAITSTYNGIKNIFTKILSKNVEKIEEDAGKYSELNMFKKLVFYFQDEPSKGYKTQMIRKFNEILTSVKRDFVKENKTTFDKYPALKESLLNDVRDMTPTSYLDSSLWCSNKEDGTPDYEKGDGVNLWVMHCYKFNSQVFLDLIKERQSYGEQFWWYTCNRTSPTLAYYVESKTMNMRLQGWQQFEYNLLGVLYWDVVQWGGLSDNNPYKSLSDSRYPWGAGEGVLLYPGYQYGLKTPVSSIRLENIFQAQEDYEYLYLLREYLEEYNSKNATNYVATEVVSNMIKDLHERTYIKEEATPEQLESCRIRILNILEKVVTGDTASAINLIQQELN